MVCGNTQKGSLVRGGLGGGRGGARDNWVISIVNQDLKGRHRRRGRRRKNQSLRGRSRRGVNMGVGRFVMKRRRRRKKGWCGIEIGREATAFFSDLNFRFLLMHYIHI